MNLPKRKPNRLENYDYSSQGAYFITLCTQGRKEILSYIDVGTGVLDSPKTILLKHGKVADKYIMQLNAFYNNISVDKYVIMPDHIHLLLNISNDGGQSRTPVPTNGNKNSVVSKFISTLKRFCNKEYGRNIWQQRYYDHIIRNETDYNDIWEYIDNNPKKWLETHK